MCFTVLKFYIGNNLKLNFVDAIMKIKSTSLVGIVSCHQCFYLFFSSALSGFIRYVRDYPTHLTKPYRAIARVQRLSMTINVDFKGVL